MTRLFHPRLCITQTWTTSCVGQPPLHAPTPLSTAILSFFNVMLLILSMALGASYGSSVLKRRFGSCFSVCFMMPCPLRSYVTDDIWLLTPCAVAIWMRRKQLFTVSWLPQSYLHLELLCSYACFIFLHPRYSCLASIFWSIGRCNNLLLSNLVDLASSECWDFVLGSLASSRSD